MTERSQLPNEEHDENPHRSAGWIKKFGNACRGIKIAMRAEVSFFVHMFATAIVVVSGWLLDVTRLQWCVLALAIASVFVAELCNTAIERIARVITREHHVEIRDALDIASGAVLVAALGAIVVGFFILGKPVLEMLL